MGKTQQQAEDAVTAGYWHLYRFDPRLEAEGKNPFQLDSKEPDWSKFQDFLKSEVRYTSLLKDFPGEAGYLFKQAEENAKWRYNSYKRFSQMDFTPAEASAEAPDGNKTE
jgi:pyruvate-ferredoxin/flavodoxin oxidoreductase